MMNVVKSAFNVTLDDPGASGEASVYISERSHATSSWAEAVGAVAKLLLIDRFEGHF